VSFKRKMRRRLLRESLERMPPPFQGEMMECVVCGASEQSMANRSMGWRCVELNSKDRYYVCPKELPADGSPGPVWRDAFLRWFKLIAEKTPGYKPARSVLYWREAEGKVTNAHLN
jgi:hypothetical protein